jgi:hypothetical protein
MFAGWQAKSASCQLPSQPPDLQVGKPAFQPPGKLQGLQTCKHVYMLASQLASKTGN